MAFPLIQSRLSSEIKDDDTHEPLVQDADDGVSNHSMLSSLRNRESLLSNLPWLHDFDPESAACDRRYRRKPGSGRTWTSERAALASGPDFCSDNAQRLVIGFGIAIYGCVIYRQLQRRIHDQVQLGPYTLHELIGSGGMGDVYLAEHRLLKRKCAVKLIRRDRASDRRMLARFEREVKATAQLTHWNTVQVYDYGRTSNGTFYYAMEYLQGLNLRQLVEQFGPQSPARTIYILRQLCSALHEAHCWRTCASRCQAE